MPIQYILAIDCGTSYIKVSAFNLVDNGCYTLRSKSIRFKSNDPFSIDFARRTHDTVLKLLFAILSKLNNPHAEWHSITIFAISPVIVAFDPNNANHAISMPYWRIREFDESLVGLDKTARRINILAEFSDRSGMRNPVVSDLIGYINYRLTGNLTLNRITAGELGFERRSDIEMVFDENKIEISNMSFPAPADVIGAWKPGIIPGTIPVFAGAPDSFAAAVGSGAVTKGSRMIYLGTFGSLLETASDLNETFFEKSNCRAPYAWRLSVPRFGPTIEKIATKYWPRPTVSESLHALDEAAASADPGASGSYLRLPVWNAIGVARGKYEFVSPLRSMPLEVRARATLESLAYALRAYHPEILRTGCPIYLYGGGAQSTIWRQVLADTLGVKLFCQTIDGAIGAAHIAQLLNAQHAMSTTSPRDIPAHDIQDVANRAGSYYMKLALSR